MVVSGLSYWGNSKVIDGLHTTRIRRESQISTNCVFSHKLPDFCHNTGFVMTRTIIVLAVFLLSSTPIAAQDIDSEHARKTLEIYTKIIEIETSRNLGNVPGMARYLADEMIGAGLPEADVEIVPIDGTAALIARYRGNDSSGKAPILLLAHMDVVEARPED